jgi:hypothetical protein
VIIVLVLHIVYKSSNNVWHLITKTITTLQHSATLYHTSPNYTSLTSLHFTTLIDTLLPLIYTSPPFHLALRIYISYRSISLHITSHHINRHSTNLISKIISKKVNPFIALKNFSPFHFTFYFIYLFVYLSYQPYTSLHFAIPNYNLLPFTSLPFTFCFLSPLLPFTGLPFPNPRFWKYAFYLGKSLSPLQVACSSQ